MLKKSGTLIIECGCGNKDVEDLPNVPFVPVKPALCTHCWKEPTVIFVKAGEAKPDPIPDSGGTPNLGKPVTERLMQCPDCCAKFKLRDDLGRHIEKFHMKAEKVWVKMKQPCKCGCSMALIISGAGETICAKCSKCGCMVSKVNLNTIMFGKGKLYEKTIILSEPEQKAEAKPMDFSEALKLLKMGVKVWRMNWDGCGYVEFKKGTEESESGEVLSVHDMAQINIGEPFLIFNHCKEKSLPELWVPCTSDLLAEDWWIVP